MRVSAAIFVVALSSSVVLAMPQGSRAQSSQRPEPPMPKTGPYSCSPQYMAQQISKTKAALDVSDWSMADVVRSAGEDASQCYDALKHPHYQILEAFFYYQGARLFMLESPPDAQDATALIAAADKAMSSAGAYALDATDLKMFNVVKANSPAARASSGLVYPGDVAATPVAIDSCSTQPLIQPNTLLPSPDYVDIGIAFHATDADVTMIEFVFWFQDSFGDRQGIVYSGISNGSFSPGITISPRRALVGYLGRTGIHPNEAVWPLYTGGKAGSAGCDVYKVRLANGNVWTNHRYDSAFPTQLP